jgi:signal transduction histidine kinase/CheY-like chemotaxis protein
MSAEAADGREPAPSLIRTRLFRKYLLLFMAVVSLALFANGATELWFTHAETEASLIRLQRAHAAATADKIGLFLKGIEDQVGWTTQFPWSDNALEARRFDSQRLLRQAPAIAEIAVADGRGRERLRVSRIAPDIVASNTDLSQREGFAQARRGTAHYSPVYFRGDSEPFLTIAVAGAHREAGVVFADVNLRFMWDVVAETRVGDQGRVYVVDRDGRLIAHPDPVLALRHLDLSALPQVAAALAGATDTAEARGIDRRAVLSAHAPVAARGWLVFVDVPLAEANRPLYAATARSVGLLAAALALAFLASFWLTRRMVVPIATLGSGAARLGLGLRGERIAIRTGDELEALAGQFNDMAERLEASHSELERKVAERTRELGRLYTELQETNRKLEQANLAKSRLVAAASHDLRQPLHALGLFAAQLGGETRPDERRHLAERMDRAVGAMNEQFNALLDISRLEAGTMVAEISVFPVRRLFERIESAFAGPADERSLSLRLVETSVWIRSDPVLLERIVANFVSNALRYTRRGGVVVGVRRQGRALSIEVYDTGPGIPEERRRHIFGEFVQFPGPDAPRAAGLGLGLAIVDRLGRLLDHEVRLRSQPGRGSRFSVIVPIAAAGDASEAAGTAPEAGLAPAGTVVVVDDDALVLEGMGGLLAGWGYRPVLAPSQAAALERLAREATPPAIIISDCHLARDARGVDAIAAIRARWGQRIPAFLMTGDTSEERSREARAAGLHLLRKPVPPMALRAMIMQLLKGAPVDAQGVMG